MLERRTTRVFTDEKFIDSNFLSNFLKISLGDLKEVRELAMKETSKKPHYWSLSKFIVTEIYLVIIKCKDIKPGLYRYDIKHHNLVLIKYGKFEDIVAKIAIGQGVKNASAALFMTADLNKYMWRYRHSRALRNIYIEAGQLAQRIILTAQSLGARNFLTPALRDTVAAEFLGLKENQHVTYLISIGK